MYLTHTESKHEIVKSLRLLISVAFASVFANLLFRMDYALFSSGSGEITFTELFQLIAIGITAYSFFVISRHHQQVKHAAYLVLGFFIVLFIRELDFLFDYIWHGFWVYPALSITFIACLLAYQGKQSLINEMAYLLRMPSMKLIIIGVALLLFFTRLYGMGDFWAKVMSDNYVREVKTLSEEGSELLSYYLISLGSIYLRKALKSEYLLTR